MKKVTNDKRAEQNRNAQKAFRQRQQQQLQLLKEKQEKYQELKQAFLQIQHLNQELLMEFESRKRQSNVEREQLIHLIDKLRTENELLSSRFGSISAGYHASGNNHSNNGNYGRNTLKKSNGNYGIVKGCHYVYRPPMVPFTGLTNTFCSVNTPPPQPTSSTTSKILVKGQQESSESTFPYQSDGLVNSGCIVSDETVGSSDGSDDRKQPHYVQFSYTDCPTSHVVADVVGDVDTIAQPSPCSFHPLPLNLEINMDSKCSTSSLLDPLHTPTTQQPTIQGLDQSLLNSFSYPLLNCNSFVGAGSGSDCMDDLSVPFCMPPTIVPLTIAQPPCLPTHIHQHTQPFPNHKESQPIQNPYSSWNSFPVLGQDDADGSDRVLFMGDVFMPTGVPLYHHIPFQTASHKNHGSRSTTTSTKKSRTTSDFFVPI
jgi:hypothetical protein